MHDNRATRPTLFLKQPEMSRLPVLRTVSSLVGGAIAGAYVALFMSIVLLVGSLVDWSPIWQVQPFLRTVPLALEEIIFFSFPIILGVFTGFVESLAHAGRNRVASRVGSFCACLAVVPPLILLCILTVWCGFSLSAWLCASPLLIFGWSLSRWSKRLHQSV